MNAVSLFDAKTGKAAGDDGMRRQAQEKINHLASKYKKFSDVSGLPTKVQRMSVSGFRRVKPHTAYHLRNDLPRGFKDTRKIGRQISDSELEEFLKYAESKGVQIGHSGSKSGGFRFYCGDPAVLRDIVDEVARQQESHWYKISGAKPPIICYDNVLGYDDENNRHLDSVIDVEAYAMTKGRVITLNKFMFDDSGYMLRSLKASVKEGTFVGGDGCKTIISHEVGHIIGGKKSVLYIKTINLLKQKAFSAKEPLHCYISKNISNYAHKLTEDGYSELIPEISTALTFGKKNGIINLLRDGGILQ